MKVDLRKSLFILPNLFTLSSVLCGFYAIVISATGPSNDDFYRAAILILFAMLFDTVDGRVARLTRTQSAIGVQLDSLADLVSFGVAPALLVYQWSLEALGIIGLLTGFAYVAAGAVRLARFNVVSTGEGGAPKTPSKYILGLPIPAAAGILISLVAANHKLAGELPGSPWIVLAVVLGLSFFMVSTVRFRSFKDLRLSWRSIAFVSVAVLGTVAVALRFHIAFALAWLLGAYVAIGVAEALFRASRRGLDRRRSTLEDEYDDEEPAADVQEEAEQHGSAH
ncbi:MAG: CDP-diacylglycerol--serine O-phosphatidyltransferase [Myxococcota bacterium]